MSGSDFFWPWFSPAGYTQGFGPVPKGLPRRTNHREISKIIKDYGFEPKWDEPPDSAKRALEMVMQALSKSDLVVALSNSPARIKLIQDIIPPTYVFTEQYRASKTSNQDMLTLARTFSMSAYDEEWVEEEINRLKRSGLILWANITAQNSQLAKYASVPHAILESRGAGKKMLFTGDFLGQVVPEQMASSFEACLRVSFGAGFAQTVVCNSAMLFFKTQSANDPSIALINDSDGDA